MVSVEFLTDSAERIGEEPFVPSLLSLDLQCLTILEAFIVSGRSLEEGCGLLLGTGLANFTSDAR